MPGARASSPPTTPHLRARASSPPPAICHVGAQASSPHAGSAGFQPASSDMPPGCAGVQPACRVHRHCARIQRYTPSPLHRLGARASRPHTAMRHLGTRASSPHAGCAGVAPAYSDTPHHPCTAWVRRRRARMPGAQALRPHTAIHPITPAPHGCAGVSPACRELRAIHGSGNGFLIMLSHPDKCLDCGFHKRADSILQQWLKRCQRFADRFAFTLSQITFPLLRP